MIEENKEGRNREEIGAYLKADFRAAEARAREEASATDRWLLASLLALNGGALVAIFNADTPVPFEAAKLFLYGIMTAFFSGMLKSSGQLDLATTWSTAEWKLVSSTPPDYAGAKEILRNRSGWGLIASILLGVSIVLFFMGATATGKHKQRLEHASASQQTPDTIQAAPAAARPRPVGPKKP